MTEFRKHVEQHWCKARALFLFVIRLLLILAMIALPCFIWLRLLYYNFIVFDNSVLSIEIANEMTAVSYFVAPLFPVLGKYILSGLQKAYPTGRTYRVFCSIADWLLNVTLIVAGIRLAMAFVAFVMMLIGR